MAGAPQAGPTDRDAVRLSEASQQLGPPTSRRFRLVRLALAVAALILATPSLIYLSRALERERALDKDFGQEYLLARAILDGINPYQPIRDLAARYLSPTGLLDKPFPTPHPPTAGVLFIPFVAVDYATAAQVWTVIELLCVPVAVVLALRIAHSRIGIGWTVVLVIGLLGWTPVLVDVALAQLTLAMVALLAGAELALSEGARSGVARADAHRRDAVGGALLGLALALKPLAWPWLIVLVWRRNWRALLGCLAVIVALLLVAALRVGLSPLVTYATDVMPSISASYALEPTNISLWTLGPRLFGATTLGHLVGLAVPALVLAIAVLWLTVRRPATNQALAVMTCVAVVVSPIAWDYDLVLLIVPLILLAGDVYRDGFPRRVSAVTAVAALGLYIPLPIWQSVPQLTLAPTGIGVLLAAVLASSRCGSNAESAGRLTMGTPTSR